MGGCDLAVNKQTGIGLWVNPGQAGAHRLPSRVSSETGKPVSETLSHGVAHPVPADQMQVEMKNNLPGVRAGVKDQPVAGFVNAFLICQLLGDSDHVPDQLLIPGGYLFCGGQVLIRNDEDMRRGNRVDISKGGHLLVAVDFFAGDFSCNDLTEKAIRIHVFSFRWPGLFLVRLFFKKT
jgi:hypothetical protein